MTDVKMKAADTLFISAWSSENIQPGEDFSVSAAEADRLEAAGLAHRDGEKEAKKPLNKMASKPANKEKK